MKGNDVNSVQARLKELGFNPGTIDSIFGKNTENAVKSFQTSKKISVDGIVGPVTWDYLF
jgi:peptidoglycan hydrolase-like protein with peptidoglycan-binding domain